MLRAGLWHFWLTRKNGGNGLKEHKGKLTARKRSAQAVPGVSLSPTRFGYIYKYVAIDIQIFEAKSVSDLEEK